MGNNNRSSLSKTSEHNILTKQITNDVAKLPLDSPDLIKTLKKQIIIARMEGELDTATGALERLVTLLINQPREEATGKLELAQVLRLQWMSKHDFSLLARAEDLLVTLSREYQTLYDRDSSNEDVRLMLAEIKSALSLVQGSYGRHQDALTLSENALTLFSQTPLINDTNRWTLNKEGQWKNSSGISPSFTEQPEPSFHNVVSTLPDNRTSLTPVKSTVATTTTTTTTIPPSSSSINSTSQPPNISSLNNQPLQQQQQQQPINLSSSSRKWRLVLVTNNNTAVSSPALPTTTSNNPQLSSSNMVVATPPRASSSTITKRSKQSNATATPPVEDNNNPVTSVINLTNEQLTVILGLDVGMNTSTSPTVGNNNNNNKSLNEFIILGTKKRHGKIISSVHATLRFSSLDGLWIIEDMKKSKGILVNGVRVRKALLRAGDQIQFGDCEHVKLGECIMNTSNETKSVFRYVMERIIDFTDVGLIEGVHFPSNQQGNNYNTIMDSPFYNSSQMNSSNNGNNSSTGGGDEKAFQHFHFLTISSQLALGLPKLDTDEIVHLYSTAISERIPFHFWDSWISCTIAKIRYR
jgi:hypothetical protein